MNDLVHGPAFSEQVELTAATNRADLYLSIAHKFIAQEWKTATASFVHAYLANVGTSCSAALRTGALWYQERPRCNGDRQSGSYEVLYHKDLHQTRCTLLCCVAGTSAKTGGLNHCTCTASTDTVVSP